MRKKNPKQIFASRIALGVVFDCGECFKTHTLQLIPPNSFGVSYGYYDEATPKLDAAIVCRFCNSKNYLQQDL